MGILSKILGTDRIIKEQQEQIKALQELLMETRRETYVAPSQSRELSLEVIDPRRTNNASYARAMIDRSSSGYTSDKTWAAGLKRFVKTETPFDRIIFPSNFPIDSNDPLESREVKKLVEDLRKTVNGQGFFDICVIKKIMDMCGCATPVSSRWMDHLREHHCEDLNKNDPELFNKLPDILNHFFSNGAIPLTWD